MVRNMSRTYKQCASPRQTYHIRHLGRVADCLRLCKCVFQVRSNGNSNCLDFSARKEMPLIAPPSDFRPGSARSCVSRNSSRDGRPCTSCCCTANLYTSCCALIACPMMLNDHVINSDGSTGFEDIVCDFHGVLGAIDDLQERVRRLTNTVTSKISSEDSCRGLKDNQNMAWVATILNPLMFVAGLYSMNQTISDSKLVFKW